MASAIRWRKLFSRLFTALDTGFELVGLILIAVILPMIVAVYLPMGLLDIATNWAEKRYKRHIRPYLAKFERILLKHGLIAALRFVKYGDYRGRPKTVRKQAKKGRPSNNSGSKRSNKQSQGRLRTTPKHMGHKAPSRTKGATRANNRRGKK